MCQGCTNILQKNPITAQKSARVVDYSLGGAQTTGLANIGDTIDQEQYHATGTRADAPDYDRTTDRISARVDMTLPNDEDTTTNTCY